MASFVHWDMKSGHSNNRTIVNAEKYKSSVYFQMPGTIIVRYLYIHSNSG